MLECGSSANYTKKSKTGLIIVQNTLLKPRNLKIVNLFWTAFFFQQPILLRNFVIRSEETQGINVLLTTARQAKHVWIVVFGILFYEWLTVQLGTDALLSRAFTHETGKIWTYGSQRTPIYL